VSFTLGGIAQTSGPNNGSLTITGTFGVTSKGTAVVGDVVNKVGRTTGWTQGAVTNTCVNTGVSGTKIVQLCQTFVSAGVGGGDSGSDVFGLTGGNQRPPAGRPVGRELRRHAVRVQPAESGRARAGTAHGVLIALCL